MLPTIKDGEKIRLERFERGAQFSIKRGDIILFLYPKDTSKFYIKRGLENMGVQREQRSLWSRAGLIPRPRSWRAAR